MTTPNKKRLLGIKAAKKEFEKQKKEPGEREKGEKVPEGREKGTVVDMPKKETDVPHPKMPADVKEREAFVIDEMLKVVNRDPMGYLVAIDFVHIHEIKRVSYNVITGQLFIIFPETVGRIGEQDVPIMVNGKKSGGMRRELSGQITPFKTALDDKETIKAFLTVWFKKTKLTENVFEGFKHHEIAQEVIKQAMNAKQAEADGKSSILNPHTGQPVK